MKKRNLLVMFLLLILYPKLPDRPATPIASIYHIYWSSSINKARRLEQPAMRYIFVLLLAPFTLGISYLVWQWKTAAWLGTKTGSDRRVVTLILSLLLVGAIINPLILQSDINKYLSGPSAPVEGLAASTGSPSEEA